MSELKNKVVSALSKEADLVSRVGKAIGGGSFMPKFLTRAQTRFGAAHAEAAARKQAREQGLGLKKTEKYVADALKTYRKQRAAIDVELADSLADARRQRKAKKRSDKETARQEAASRVNKAIGASLLGGAGVLGGGAVLYNQKLNDASGVQ